MFYYVVNVGQGTFGPLYNTFKEADDAHDVLSAGDSNVHEHYQLACVSRAQFNGNLSGAEYVEARA